MTVIHQADRQRFEIDSEPDAYVEYERIGKQAVNFTHTYVPFRLRGQGLAEQLVHAALTWAQQQSLSIQTSCWYVAKYIENKQP